MNFAKDKIRTAFFGLIIASVVLVQLVRAKPSADPKPTGKEHPALRDNGNKSEGSVIDSAITEFNDTKLERGKARNERQKVESRILVTYCLVMSCLLLELSICVVLQFSLRKKCSQTRPEKQDAENTPHTATSPIYQLGVQGPCISGPLPITHQGPYQPLIVNTSELGASGEYRALEDGHRDDQRIGVPVDVTDYQDLHQTKPREKYKSLLVVGSFSEDRASIEAKRHYDQPHFQETLKESDAKPSTPADASSSVFHSLRSLVRSARARMRGLRTSSSPSKYCPTRASHLDQSDNTLHLEVTTEKEPVAPARDCNVSRQTEDQMHRVVEELETTVNTRALSGNHAKEPLYYVLETPFPSPEFIRDPMHCVVKELERLNENNSRRAPSEYSTAEPLYYVLESSEDSEDKISKEETNP